MAKLLTIFRWRNLPRWVRLPIVLMLTGFIAITMLVTAIVLASGDSDYKGRLIDPIGKPLSGTTNPILKQQIITTIPQYVKGEEQTYLTLPEWYLVFNPNEYADYLNNGNNPSDFPFLDSINEYWSLYDRVSYLTADVYPENGEYKTMLQVIGVSTTAEFLIKGLYETTIGRLSLWTASGDTSEDYVIRQAHTAYGRLILSRTVVCISIF